VRPLAIALALGVAAAGCGKDDLRAAEAAVDRGTEKVTEVARASIETVDQGIDIVSKEVADVVDGSEELPDAKLVEQVKKAIACKKERCTMPRDLADELFDRTSLMSEQARTYQLERGGKTIGVQLDKLGPIPKALGFRAGDVLVTVNGIALDTVQGLAQMFVEMKTAEQLEISYRRGKRMRTKTIAFV
jgi:type II secretory pathway component PulC